MPGLARLCRWEVEEGYDKLPEKINSSCIAITSDLNVPTLLVRLQKVGALGVILRDTISVYAGTYDLPYPPTKGFDNITVVQTGSIDTYRLWGWLANNTEPIIVQIGGNPPDRNVWLEVRSSPVWYAVQALMSVFCLTALVMALYKLVKFLKYRGFEGGVPQICLFFETAGNLFRVIYWAVDPIFLLRGPYNYAVANVLLSIHVPMFVASTLCLSLHWHEILSQATVAVPLGLSKLKWPFVVLVAILFIFEFISAGLRAIDIDPFALVIVSSVVALLVVMATSAFFLVSAVRVVRFLSRDAMDLTSAERRSPIVRKTVRIVVASAVFEILFAIVIILIAVPDLFYDPRAFHILLTIKDVFLSCISFTQIMAFKPPKGVKHRHTGTGATVTTDSQTSKRGAITQEMSQVRSDITSAAVSSSDREESSSSGDESESGSESGSQSGAQVADSSSSDSEHAGKILSPRRHTKEESSSSGEESSSSLTSSSRHGVDDDVRETQHRAQQSSSSTTSPPPTPLPVAEGAVESDTGSEIEDAEVELPKQKPKAKKPAGSRPAKKAGVRAKRGAAKKAARKPAELDAEGDTAAATKKPRKKLTAKSSATKKMARRTSKDKDKEPSDST